MTYYGEYQVDDEARMMSSTKRNLIALPDINLCAGELIGMYGRY